MDKRALLITVSLTLGAFLWGYLSGDSRQSSGSGGEKSSSVPASNLAPKAKSGSGPTSQPPVGENAIRPANGVVPDKSSEKPEAEGDTEEEVTDETSDEVVEEPDDGTADEDDGAADEEATDDDAASTDEEDTSEVDEGGGDEADEQPEK